MFFSIFCDTQSTKKFIQKDGTNEVFVLMKVFEHQAPKDKTVGIRKKQLLINSSPSVKSSRRCCPLPCRISIGGSKRKYIPYCCHEDTFYQWKMEGIKEFRTIKQPTPQINAAVQKIQRIPTGRIRNYLKFLNLKNVCIWYLGK